MVFDRLLASVGIGGAKVDTRLSNPSVTPGAFIRGTVNLQGGSVDQTIERIDVALEAIASHEVGDGVSHLPVVIGSETVALRMEIKAGKLMELPFQIQVPMDTPLNRINGYDTPVEIFLRTHVHLANAVDSGDKDPVTISPLPAQRAVFDAMARLGFRIKKVDVEYGQIRGSRLPFFQEIEYAVGSNYLHQFQEIEITFLNREFDMDVIFEIDRRARGIQVFMGGPDDAIRALTVNYSQVQDIDFEDLIERTILN